MGTLHYDIVELLEDIQRDLKALYTLNMTAIQFSEYKDRIQQKMNERVGKFKEPDPEGYTLVDGFIQNTPVSSLTGDVVIGGPVIPVVAIVGKSTGEIHYFALKVLIPELEI